MSEHDIDVLAERLLAAGFKPSEALRLAEQQLKNLAAPAAEPAAPPPAAAAPPEPPAGDDDPRKWTAQRWASLTAQEHGAAMARIHGTPPATFTHGPKRAA